MGVVCGICNKLYTTQSSLNRHLNLDHNHSKRNIITYDFELHNAKCLECRCSFRYTSLLREHLHNEHNMDMEIMEKDFDNEESFLLWLEKESETNNVQYIRARGDRKTAKCESIMYYNCNRSFRAGKLITMYALNTFIA